MQTIMKAMRILLGLLMLLVMFLGSCGEEVEPSAEEQNTELLMGTASTGKTWKVQSVTVDGVDKSSLFTGMTIRFSKGNMTVTNGGVVWPATGTWTFSTSEATTIKLGNGTEIGLEVSETILKLTLTWTKNTFGPGRVSSVAGKHVFTFGL
jgi:hypothetical protein